MLILHLGSLLTRSTLCSTSSNLGSGNFGVVFKGEWSFSSGHLEVAIKMLKDGASEEDRVKFLQEAAIMGQFSHPNVVKLYGVVTVGNPVSDIVHCSRWWCAWGYFIAAH